MCSLAPRILQWARFPVSPPAFIALTLVGLIAACSSANPDHSTTPGERPVAAPTTDPRPTTPAPRDERDASPTQTNTQTNARTHARTDGSDAQPAPPISPPGAGPEIGAAECQRWLDHTYKLVFTEFSQKEDPQYMPTEEQKAKIRTDLGQQFGPLCKVMKRATYQCLMAAKSQAEWRACAEQLAVPAGT